MAYSKNRRLADLVSSAGEVSSFVDASVTHADLHTSMDLTGKTVTVANASTGDNDTTVANTAFVQQEIAALVASAPGTLNTLNELAAALGDDANYSTTTTAAIAAKLPLAGGTMTGGLSIRGFNGPVLKIGSSGSADPRIDFEDQNSTNLGGGIFLDQDQDTLRILRTVSGSATDGIAINASGNVGIGTGSPSSPLHVTAAKNDGWLAQLNNTGTGSDANGLLVHAGVDAADYIFKCEEGDGTSVLAVKYGGKVGIGTTGPDGALHIKSDTNNTIKSDFTIADGTGTYSLHSYARNGTNKWRLGSKADDSYLSWYNDATSTHQFALASGGQVGVRTLQPSRVFEVQLTAVNSSLTDANSAVHFGSGSGVANTDGYIQGITLGYKTEGSNAYAKTGIVARGRNDGAARQDLAFLVDTASDGGSVQIGDAKLTIDGITGDVKFNGGPVKGMRQVVQYQGATNATTISANSNATFQSTTITTTGNSKLVVWAHSGQILKQQQNSNPWMRIGVNGSYIGAAHEGHHYWYGVSSGTSQRLFLTEFGVSPTLAAGTHTVTMTGGTYAADMIFNYQNQSGHMVIMEVGA